MSSPFSLLGLPRRPFLSEEEIGTAYRKRAGELHPDQAEGDAASFRELGEAAAILRDPARRIRALVGSGKENQIPSQAAEFFPMIASILQQSDALQTKATAASNTLTKALLAAPLKSLTEKLQVTLDQIHDWKVSLDQELLLIDQQWPEHDPEAMHLLADSLAYAIRWESQLRERKLALETIFG